MTASKTDTTNASLSEAELSKTERSKEEIGFDYLRRILLAPVYDVAIESDITHFTKLSSRLGNNIYLKREDQQPVYSFKLRGAYTKLSNMPKSDCTNGVVAASAGNHAQGLALAASKLGIDATIFMPLTTPDIKVDNVRLLGAEVKLVGKSFNEAQIASVEYATKHNKKIIHPFDDPDVIAGQGTVAKEVLQQQSDLDVIFVPVGGGGLLAGMAVYIKQLRPDIKVIGVEAEDSACLKAALAAGEPTTLPEVGIFADGVAVKRIGDHTFNVIKHFCDEVITVTSDEICAAIKDIFEQTRIIAEPAGALSLAAINKYCKTSVGNESLLAILSGANMNFHTLRYISERCELGEQKEAVLAVTIPEQKGSFRNFCHALEGRVITEFNYRFAGKAQADIFVGVRVTDSNEKNALINTLEAQSLTVCDLTDNELAKLHVRYMIGGGSTTTQNERLFRFEFPEYPGALDNFLNTLGELWNITLFHYRNHGAASGEVLAGFEVNDEDQLEFFDHLKTLGYQWHEETENPAYKAFLS